MHSPTFSRHSLALPALALLAAACSSTPATHPPAAMQQSCTVSAAEYPPCEPAAAYYPGVYTPYGAGYLYPGVILVPVPVVVTTPVPPVPVTPPPAPKPKPGPQPKLHPRQQPGKFRDPCKTVNGRRVCP